MADVKNKEFTAKPELKNDKRLTDIFLRMGVIDTEEVKTRKSTLKDLQERSKSVSFEKVISSKN